MEILSVYDSAFKPYGRVVEGYPTEGLVKALATTPCTDGVVYLPRVEVLHSAPNAAKIGEGLYGGMPYELGYCNGHNTKLNCLEFHRDSEFNLGTDDFILLLATLSDLEDGELDTAKVKAFKVPAGVMVEVYATTLHYAPCHADAKKGFRVMVALPDQTNTDFRPEDGANKLDKTLWARNKWLLAHPDSSEAKQGAAVLLKVAGQIGRKARLADAVQSCPMTDVETVGAYLLERYAGETHEIVYELCLDRKGKLLACKRLNDGGASSAALDIRKMVENAILTSASTVILAHNHPSGIALPSDDDCAATTRAAQALQTIGVALADHIIVADDDFVSMAQSGYLTPWEHL